MERRITRAAAARQAALLAAGTQPVQPQLASSSNKVNIRKRASVAKDDLEDASPKKETVGEAKPKRRKKKDTVPILINNDELPHNLGKAIAPQNSDSTGLKADLSAEIPSFKKEDIDKLADELQQTVDKATDTLKQEEPVQEKKGRKKKTNIYGLTPGFSPFPDWPHPTAEECEEVNRLLSSVHGDVVPPTTIPEPSLTVTGCGEVPSVLDALIRTLLSGATTGNNSAMAFNGLVQKFGILEEGIGKGSVNWDAVRQAPVKDVYEAMKSGGLADIKSKNLKAILEMVYTENQERKAALLKAEKNEFPDATVRNEEEKEYEIACADQNFLSLNHYHHLSTEQAMMEMVKYPGIGPKTAACVVLFCLQRPCFAVDTHIFRICKWLGWVPPNKSTEITAFSHLEVRIPDHLKYSLHQLFIRHGKTCPRCRAMTGQSAEGWDDGCVIDHLVTRTGKRKGGAVPESPEGEERADRPRRAKRGKRD